MKLLIPAAAGAALLLVASAAMADVSGLVGNTVVGTFPDGNTVKVHMKADGTFDQTMGGQAASGTYAIDPAKGVCMTQTTPAPPADAQPMCVPSLDGKKVGDSWDLPGPKEGTTVKVTVVAGQ